MVIRAVVLDCTARTRVLRCLFALSAGVAAFATAPFAMSADRDAGRSTPAEHGGSLYAAQCAMCHGSKLAGGQFGPALKGRDFRTKWGGAGGENALLDFITHNMPPGRSESLGPDQYRTLEQVIVAANEGMPAGSPRSAADAARSFSEISAARPAAGPTPDSSAARAGQGMQAVFDTKHVGPIPSTQIFHDAIYAQVTADRTRLLTSLTPVTDALLEAPPGNDWLAWRGSDAILSFSPLTQIDRRSVAKLALIWAWSLPVGINECAPLIHDGILFVQSGNRVQALDAADGTLLWQYLRDLPPEYRGTPNAAHRNFALYGRNVYISTADRHVVALDARTGKLVWDHEVVPPDVLGVLLSAGPIAVHGKIIQGTSLGPYCKGGCFVVGLDAATGSEVWRFNTVARPGESGGHTWNDAPVEQRYGAASWVAPSYDSQTNLIYLGTGSTYLIAPLLRKRSDDEPGNNDALYTDSTLAINPDTGHLAWYHQHLRHDVWDLDEVFERSLITVPMAGAQRKLLVTIGKIGILDALDPATGAFVFAKDLGLQNIVTSIDARTGARTLDPATAPRAHQAKTICPSAEGARNWMTTAYNPHTHVLYIPMEEACMDFIWQPDADPADSDGIDIGWTLKPLPGSDGRYGRIQAIDMVDRKSLWVRRQRALVSSSLLATEGGLVFAGDRNRMFQALDDRTGAPLWSVRLDAMPNSSPVTYGVGGRQFVAVATGGGGPHDSQSVDFTPEISDAAPSTTLWVFSLR